MLLTLSDNKKRARGRPAGRRLSLSYFAGTGTGTGTACFASISKLNKRLLRLLSFSKQTRQPVGAPCGRPVPHSGTQRRRRWRPANAGGKGRPCDGVECNRCAKIKRGNRPGTKPRPVPSFQFRICLRVLLFPTDQLIPDRACDPAQIADEDGGRGQSKDKEIEVEARKDDGGDFKDLALHPP